MSRELKKENLREALSILAKRGQVVLPVRQGANIVFAPWDGRGLPDLSKNADFSPKETVLPGTEKLYGYDARTGEISETGAPPARILFGIRPCAARSVARLDRVFLEKGYTDSLYQAKRDALTMICLACAAPARACFCESVGDRPDEAENADVMLYEGPDGFEVRARSEKGEAVADAWAGILTEKAADTEKTKKTVKSALRVETDESLPEKLAARFDAPLWDELARACVGCGTCSFVCPTCYCFDIGQETKGSRGAAFRCWDSCMFSDYSRMAGGHDPRPTKKERLRNRYLHKFAYFNQRYGQTLCVGCGRCLEKCPANLDITRAIERVVAADV